MRRVPIALALASLAITERVPAQPAPPATGKVVGVVDVIDDHGKPMPIEDVWVYLVKVSKARHAGTLGAGVTKTIVQKHQEFTPHVVVVPAGATVNFPNEDTQDHNVFSPSYVDFDLGVFGPGSEKHPHVFKEIGDHDVFCDRHKNMWAVVKTVDTTFIAAVSPKDGAYELTDIPDGDYKVVAWLPHGTEYSSDPVHVRANTVTATSIHLHPGQKPGTHKRKDGISDYGQY
jgi:plastocyanin